MMGEDDKVKPVETAVEAEVRYSEADNLDMKNRDPLHLNTHIAVSITLFQFECIRIYSQ